MNLEITYLVVNYNNGRYIKDCIDCLQTQTNSNWRCLICDDKSTDNSFILIEPLLNEKIQLITNEKNVGKTSSLIELINHAKTDIVGILDPDDALYPEATEFILKAYDKNPQVGFIYTNYDVFDESLRVKEERGLSTAIPSGGCSLIDGFVGAIRTYRRSVYDQSQGYDPEILYAEDRDLVYKMEEVTNFFFIDKSLYKYRRVPNSQSTATEKAKIGEKNHLIAFQNALNRRQIMGVHRWGYLLWWYACYIEHKYQPSSQGLNRKILFFQLKLMFTLSYFLRKIGNLFYPNPPKVAIADKKNDYLL